MRTENGFYIWQKIGLTYKLSKNFSSNEFSCKCSKPNCKEQRISIEMVNRLQVLRDTCGPITINEGFRCEEYQQQLLNTPGIEAAKKSQHVLGMAADIKLGASLLMLSSDFVKLKETAETLFKAIGTGKKFLHLDMREDKIRRWTYSY